MAFTYDELHEQLVTLARKDRDAASYDCEVHHEEYDELIIELFVALKELTWKYDGLCK